MKALFVLFALALAVALTGLLLEAAAFGGAFVLHQRSLYDDEIRWLDGFRPMMRWERGVERLAARRRSERIERALHGDRIDRAVHLFREARQTARRTGQALDPEMTALGIETFRRAANRMVRHGRLSEGANWLDSLFVLAIRAPAPHQRYVALSGFVEGLDLRVRDGKPCAALARVRWAKQGLGGAVPGMAENIEEDLAQQCRPSRAGR
jgi:hypothetical protein